MIAARLLLVVSLVYAAAGQTAPAVAAPTAAPFVVNYTLDEPDATTLDGVCFSTPSGKCTLRAAVMQANANAGPDEIHLDAGYYVLNRTGLDNNAYAGDLDISDDLIIRGAGAYSSTIVVDRNAVHERVLQILLGVVRLEALGVTGGDSQLLAGGGIANDGQLTLDHTAVYSNNVTLDGGAKGGGLYNSGQLTITHSLIEYNKAGQGGGGLRNSIGAWAWIEASTIAHNVSIDNFAGGILNAGNLLLVNSTLSSNASNDGGSALHNDGGTLNAYNVTITANIHDTDEDAGSADAGLTNEGGTVNLRNSIVARNYALVGGLRYYDDCSGILTVVGNVYFSGLGFSPPGSTTAPCSFVIGSGGNAYVNIGGGELLPLGANGGPTPTHDLDPGSDAYDGADATFGCLGPDGLLLTDQRGVPRVAGVRCDAGAVEHGSLWHLFAPLVVR